MDRDELAAWLRLLRTPGVGRDSARRLLAAFGSPQAVFAATPAAWREVVGPVKAGALGTEPEGWAGDLRATIGWLEADPARSCLVLGDPAYPAMLLETADPPLLLFAQGRLELLRRPALAIVGSRRPTAQGRDNARAFARHLSDCGLTIVSGLADGIDGAAHEGGLTGAGSTIAVVGTGLDRVYPDRHQPLARRISEAGLMLSEYPLGTPPIGENFPQRNRIIAGLARGTLVVEAALQSGSLITARLALEAGREVFAIPGSIHSAQSRGCHALIKQGAKLVESADEVLEDMRLGPAASAPPAAAAPVVTADRGEATADAPADADDALMQALGHDPASLDALLARTGLDVGTLNARLLELELEGRLARLPGGLFQRRGAA